MKNKQVVFEKLRYSLNELFEDQPIFEEPLIQYRDILVNPTDDVRLVGPLHEQEFIRAVNRYNSDALKQQAKDRWKQL